MLRELKWHRDHVEGGTSWSLELGLSHCETNGRKVLLWELGSISVFSLSFNICAQDLFISKK